VLAHPRLNQVLTSSHQEDFKDKGHMRQQVQ
jgi:hypothetical protein